MSAHNGCVIENGLLKMHRNILVRVGARAAACAACFATPAFAHHPGGPGNTGGSGPINTISATTLPAGMSGIAIVYDRIGLDALSDATLIGAAEAAAAAGEHAHVHSIKTIASPSLNYAYGLTNDLTVAVRLPYVIRTDIRAAHFHEDEGEGEVHAHGDSDGIGDMSALLQWRLVNSGEFEAALLAGLKAPTGRTHELDRSGERFDAEFQPGSGSWDGMAGLALTRRFGPLSLDASALYMLTGTGAQDTDLGDRFHYGIAASYRIRGLGGGDGGPMFHGARAHAPGDDGHGHVHSEGAPGPALDLILELNGEWHGKQETGGEKDPNSGGHVLYVAPGLRLSQDRWSAFASLGIPIVNDLNGIQAEPDWRLVTGVAFSF